MEKHPSGFNYAQMQKLLVYQLFSDIEAKTYYLALDIRDYEKNFCAMWALNKSFITNMIKDMNQAEEAGFTYKELGMDFRKGKDER